MDFKFTDETQLLQEMVREFTEKEIQPIAAEIDEEERFPEEMVAKMAELGFLGIPFPEEYGGSGMTNLDYVVAVEEISKACASTGVIVSAHTSLAAWPIYNYGTEEQKQKYLIPLATGEKLGAFGLTEPGAGTDAAGQETKAEDKGDYYLLNGSKIFITNGYYADIYIIFAMTDRELGNRGISAFILEKGMPGFSFGTKEKKMGIRASATYELIFEDVKVPKENLLGELNKGFGVAMATLDGGRLGIGAQALGIAEGAFNAALAYVKEREQFGRPLAKFQNTQFRLADMYSRIESSKLTLYRAVCLKDEGVPYSTEAAMAKLLCSETAREVTWQAVQLFGGYGYTREYPVERMMRDAKITEIYEGTSEVMKMVIWGHLNRVDSI
ncbi:MAG TPA: acyl-CoA dehydrogenase [Clostridiaceae bacterium]|nr:acyl-CoA dehydrogenase [Clostridiaceae bacterium]